MICHFSSGDRSMRGFLPMLPPVLEALNHTEFGSLVSAGSTTHEALIPTIFFLDSVDSVSFAPAHAFINNLERAKRITPWIARQAVPLLVLKDPKFSLPNWT
jgi:hypothetical protein